MTLAEVTLGARHWLLWAVLVTVLACALLAWSYLQRGRARGFRTLAALLKATAIVALAVCLVEPLYTGSRPRPGSNIFLVVADNSRSLQLTDHAARQSRGGELREQLAEQSDWLARLGQDFDLRRYTCDTALRPAKTFAELTFDGEGSALQGTLASLAERYRGQPVAGILLFTDGNLTDASATPPDWKDAPPVFPVAIGSEAGLVDLSVTRVSVSQTNFEAAPVTVLSEVDARGVAGRTVVVRVLDDKGKEVECRTLANVAADKPLVERFLLRPEHSGVSFYSVQACLEGEEALNASSTKSAEATLANNRRFALIDRGGGPYRVLYVSGRPNWEFKFLRRGLDEDDEVQLVGLIRIAKREPKFNFLGRSGERTNPLFRGFGNQQDEAAEQYDQPVLLRLGAENQDELRGGFPKTAEDLFRYQAVILDDIEAAFFTQDQISLLQQFVSRRGGGLLMLGGKDSFVDGGYQRGGIGEMLPIYLDRSEDAPPGTGYRLVITREGWLQPWVRLRATEDEEQQRIAALPEFRSVNRIDAIKPGATVLAEVATADGAARPALAVQQFGRGRTAALLIGDLWRGHLRRSDAATTDLEKSWRQTVRWLISDVPGMVEVETTRTTDGAVPSVQIVVRARDKQFAPLENATVTLNVETPDQRKIELSAESSDRAPGEYVATFTPRAAGAYRAQVAVKGADGGDAGSREIGWASEPQTEEFRTLGVNRDWLARVAEETGGEMVPADRLERFVAGLPNRKLPVVETWTYPLWHRWPVFLLAIVCLVGEWGLRRWKGMP